LELQSLEGLAGLEVFFLLIHMPDGKRLLFLAMQSLLKGCLQSDFL
jgi:hypothetical protein